jgi:threonine/homoserine/homoserine lactone efflux protein
VVMTITPGPNNLMVAAGAANHGIARTVPHIAGICVGFSAMTGIVAAGLGGAVMAVPWLYPAMRWAGAAWLLYFAWKIAIAATPGESGQKRAPIGFMAAAAFQWVNPKAWLMALSAASQFVVPSRPLWLEAGKIAVVFALVALPCILPWALLGSGAGRLLGSSSRLRLFNTTMAVLLLACVVPLLLG